MSERKLYTVYHVKIPLEERDVSAAYLGDENFVDAYAEDAAVGEFGRYGAWLDQEGVEAYLSASNLRDLEEAVPVHAIGVLPDTAMGMLDTYGVDKAALDYSGFDRLPNGSGDGSRVVVGVGDTGYLETSYTANKLIAAWGFVDGQGTKDNHGHGRWCCNAAVGPNSKLISGKVLGDNGSGYSTYGIAFADKFVTWCRSNDREGVLSYSLGGSSYSRGYEEVAQRALQNRVVPVAASGNDGHTDRISYPAGTESWLATGAISHHTGQVASFSNRHHPEEPNIYAPGVQVEGYGGRWSGTSMATPIAARAVSYLLSVKFIGPVRARNALMLEAAEKQRLGTIGRLDLSASMRRALEMV